MASEELLEFPASPERNSAQCDISGSSWKTAMRINRTIRPGKMRKNRIRVLAGDKVPVVK